MDEFARVEYAMAGAEISSGTPLNSSAPISGVEPLRAPPSKSSVTAKGVAIAVPPPSTWVAVAVLMCKLYGALAPFIKGTSSVTDKLSRVPTRV